MVGARHAPGHEPTPRSLKALTYVLYADRFGWLPKEVDEIPADVECWIIPIHDLMRAVRDDAQRRANAR